MYHTLPILLLVCGMVAMAAGAVADIPTLDVLWDKTIAPEPNQSYSPGAVSFDSQTGRIVIVGTSFPAGRPPVKEGEFRIWDIDPNGQVVSARAIGAIPDRAAIHAHNSSGIIFGINRYSNGDTAIVGKVRDWRISAWALLKKGENISDATAILGEPVFKRETGITVTKAVFLDDGSVLVLGVDGTHATIVKLDAGGKILWTKLYDEPKSEDRQATVLFDAARTATKGGFVAIGRWMTMTSAMSAGEPSDTRVLKCDKDGKVLAEQRFKASLSVFVAPAICVLSSGEVVAVYDASEDPVQPELAVKVFSPDLRKVLWEKTIFKAADKLPPKVHVAKSREGGFVILYTSGIRALVVRQFDNKGNELGQMSVARSGWVSLGGNVVCTGDRVIVITSCPAAGNEQFGARVLSLKLKAVKGSRGK